jgi:DNA-binding response OmpR family regulator
MPGKLSSPVPPTSVIKKMDGNDDVYDDGHLRVEHSNYFAACDGQLLKLPRAEFLILSRLARTPERIVSPEELWQNVWGDARAFNYESIQVYIYRLRRKLAPYGIKIDTMVHMGYRLLPTASKKAGKSR